MQAISWRHTLLLLTIDGGSRSFLARFPFLQRTADDEYSFNKNTQTLMAKATPVSCKSSCWAVAKPSAEACDFLATLQRSPSTIDGELQAFSPYLPTVPISSGLSRFGDPNPTSRPTTPKSRFFPICPGKQPRNDFKPALRFFVFKYVGIQREKNTSLFSRFCLLGFLFLLGARAWLPAIHEFCICVLSCECITFGCGRWLFFAGSRRNR